MHCHEYAQTFYVLSHYLVFTLNDRKQKMNGKETKLLLRQRFSNKIGYTLWRKTHLV